MLNELTPILILAIIAAYFLLLMGVSWWTGRKADNADFFIAGRQSPWILVAIGMIGASLSGVTFISVPGWVGDVPKDSAGMQSFSYLQMVLGYLLGYLVIAVVLMPMYYRLQLTSIYTYLEERFGYFSYKTGAAFFLLSRTIGASFRLYIVAIVLQEFVMTPLGIPFWATVLLAILLIWIYTFQGGIKTIIITDTLQTVCMLAAAGLTVWAIGDKLDMTFSSMITSVQNSVYSETFFFENGWGDYRNFFKQFLAGASITIVMTGLDQDMMQKNLSCPNIRDAQKNVFTFSIILVFANILFLVLGALLYIYANQFGLTIPENTDLLYPTIALKHIGVEMPIIGIIFVLGLIAAAYSSADSALTALTTSFCVDFLNFEKSDAVETDKTRTRWLVHIGFSVVLFAVILIFNAINDTAVIKSIFRVAGYTYGPLLGLYAFGFITKRTINDKLVPLICILSPVITYVINLYSEELLFGYKFGFELLLLNGALTFLGLMLIVNGSLREQEAYPDKTIDYE